VMASDSSQATGVAVTIGSATLGTFVEVHPLQIAAWCVAILTGMVTIGFAIVREVRDRRREQHEIQENIRRWSGD